MTAAVLMEFFGGGLTLRVPVLSVKPSRRTASSSQRKAGGCGRRASGGTLLLKGAHKGDQHPPPGRGPYFNTLVGGIGPSGISNKVVGGIGSLGISNKVVGGIGSSGLGFRKNSARTRV